jgi:hypothetical protein
MGNTTTTPDRVALFTNTGTTCSLLSPWLFVASGYFTNGLGASRSRTLGCHVGHDGIVNSLVTFLVLQDFESNRVLTGIGSLDILDRQIHVSIRVDLD